MLGQPMRPIRLRRHIFQCSARGIMASGNHLASNIIRQFESLYRALSAEGNPEFATVLRVVEALGLQLSAVPTRRENAA